jgi:hypothetical protein
MFGIQTPLRADTERITFYELFTHFSLKGLASDGALPVSIIPAAMHALPVLLISARNEPQRHQCRCGRLCMHRRCH